MSPEYTRDPGLGKLLAAVESSIYTLPVNEPLYSGVDNSPLRPNDVSMTELTRQQVTDLLAASEAKAGERLANFQLDIKSGFADLRSEFSEVRAEFAHVRTEMANDRAASSKQNQDNLKWIIGAIFAMISIAVALIGAMINYSKSEKPAAVQPAPIIITVPVPQPAVAPTTALAPTPKTK